MTTFGFGMKWRGWIPLSPFLFMVAIEGLHIANYKSVMANKIKDALIRSSRFNMSHIFFYADDVVFLCD